MVVDDSDSIRATLVGILRSDPDTEILLSTGDGEEALRRALVDPPDVVCLDLEMPKMDGFTFLRLLMARRPTPVIVISSNSRKQDVFKALELGALDFIPKPEKSPGDVEPVRQELLAKIATVRALRIENLEPRAAAPRPAPAPRSAPVVAAAEGRSASSASSLSLEALAVTSPRIVVIGASTGGPSALSRLLTLLPHDVPLAIAIAQHMPEKFTRAFAERLHRATDFDVREAEDGDALLPGRVLLAPGGHHLKLVRSGAPRTNVIRALVVQPREGEARYRPSVDLLFASAAEAWGANTCGVVLTGMGNDGRAGIAAVKRAGGLTLAESERTAVVYGMPKEAVESGCVDEVLALDDIVERLVEFASGR